MVQLRMKMLFFDSPRVQRAMDAATRRALSWAGAHIRQRARASTRKGKGASSQASWTCRRAGTRSPQTKLSDQCRTYNCLRSFSSSGHPGLSVLLRW